MDVDKLYEALLRYYRSTTIWGDPRSKLESDLMKLTGRGLSREEAVKLLFEEKIGDYSVLERRAEETSTPSPEGAKVLYQGERISVIYVDTDPFYDSLPKLARVLDEIEKKHGDIIGLVPNVGFVSASLFLGTSFQGVKGVAVVVRLRSRESLSEQKDQESRR